MNNPFEVIEAKLNDIEGLILNLKHEQASVTWTQNKSFLNVGEAATLLNLAVPTIYSLVSRSEIPVNKRGKRLYFF